MYKCTDCKLEYTERPEYCDCGNNLFETIVKDETNSNEFNPTQDRLKSDIEKDNSKEPFWERNPRIKRLLNSVDPISGSIFLTCIILSIIAWFAIGSGPTQTKTQKKQSAKIQNRIKTKNIPNLDSFWNNAAPKNQTQVNNIANPTPQFSPPQPQMQPQMQQLQEPIHERPQMRPKQQSQRFNEPKVFQPQPQIAKPIKPANRSSNANNNGMSKYKSALRQLLFSHLAVASIQGSGKCQVEFAIDSNGKLVGRRFSRLSDNKSLNDAVYNMLMSVPQYYSPPSDYRGEKIRLNFYFDNGYYEVSY